MNKRLHICITDIIEKEPEAPTYNDELIILRLGHFDEDKENWVQLDAFSLLLILEGTMEITINNESYQVEKQAFIDVFDFHAVRNVRVSTNFRGYYIVLTKSFMEEAMRNIKRMPVSNFLSRYRYPVMDLEQSEAELLERAVLNIIRNTSRKEHIYQRDIIKNEIRNLFAEILNITIQRNKPIDANIYKNREEIITQFIILVRKHYKEEHNVSFYAEKLCVESKYLSRISKAVSGKTAGKFIDETIMTEAKLLLRESDMTIVEIADLLHFSDQSSFGKFFKKHCGASPSNFRRDIY